MTSLQDLSSADVHQVLRYFSSSDLLGQLPPDERYAAIQLLTARLTTHHDKVPAGDWNKVSTTITNTLRIGEQLGAIDEREHLTRLFNVSSVLLKHLPPRDDVEILAPARLVDLFMAKAPFSVGEAKELASNWKSLEAREIGRLRFIKNMLSPLLHIKRELGDSADMARLDTWEEVHPSLP